FRDEALQALVREALDRSYDVRIAAARVEQARATVGVVRADMLPQASYQGSATREPPSAALTGRSRTFDLLARALAVGWAVDPWGPCRGAPEAARADLFANGAAGGGVMLTLVADVAQAYFELCELDRELAIARRTADAFTRTRDLFATQLAGGKA